MQNVLQTAAEVGGAVLGSSGLLGLLAVAVKSKSDLKAARLGMEQAQAAGELAGERADRQQDHVEDEARYAKVRALCDDYERRWKEARAEADALRLMWEALDTTLEDVHDREKARYSREKRARRHE